MSDAEIIAMERAALDRWGKGDPQGYLEIMAPEVTYFDPIQDARVDGLESMTDLLVAWTGKIRIDRYEMLDPKVQWHGGGRPPDLQPGELPEARRRIRAARGEVNSTEIYARLDGTWRIIHSHWSYVKPDLKQPITEGT